MSKTTRYILIGIALALLLAALAWRLTLNSTGELSKIRRAINDHGYSVLEDTIYPAGYIEYGSIAEMLAGEDIDIQAAIDASKSAGFPSDVNKQGEATLILAAISDSEVITLFMINGEIEMGFIQALDGQGVSPLGK